MKDAPILTYIITAIPHLTPCRSLARLNIEQFSNDIVSLEAFSHHKRKYATEEDALVYQDRCCWGPTALFHVKPLLEWVNDMQAWQDSLVRIKNKIPLRPYYMESYGVDTEDFLTIPMFDFTSVFDFYKSIHFDYKRRCYVDAHGDPVKYSIRQIMSGKSK